MLLLMRSLEVTPLKPLGLYTPSVALNKIKILCNKLAQYLNTRGFKLLSLVLLFCEDHFGYCEKFVFLFSFFLDIGLSLL